MNFSHLLKYWLPLLVWLGVIFIGSTDLMSAQQTSRFLVPFLLWLKPNISAQTIMQIHFFVRKAGHVTEYAILAILLWRAVLYGTNVAAKMPILYGSVWLVCAIFAASDEFHQSFVPTRTAAWGDVMIDSGGAIFGLLIWSAIFGSRKARIESRKLATGRVRPTGGQEDRKL
jgi:VanZ family protein